MNPEPASRFLPPRWQIYFFAGLLGIAFVAYAFKMSIWADFFDRVRERFPWWLGVLIALAILMVFLFLDIPLLPRPR